MNKEQRKQIKVKKNRERKLRRRRAMTAYYSKSSKPVYEMRPIDDENDKLKQLTWIDQIRWKMVDVVQWIKKIPCYFGKHKWQLIAGIPGKPKMICINCYKMSKEKWTEEDFNQNIIKNL